MKQRRAVLPSFQDRAPLWLIGAVVCAQGSARKVRSLGRRGQRRGTSPLTGAAPPILGVPQAVCAEALPWSSAKSNTTLSASSRTGVA